MIVKLVLENFMAHGRSVFELAPGLNVLCGPNNTGKSAVVEALRCLAANPAPRYVIRHGHRQARVEAFLDDGWRVAWVRRKAYAIYEVFPPGQEEPQVYAKLGRGGVPPEVAQVLKLGPVELEKDEGVDIHLGDQRHPIFLLDRPGSVLADFLASSTESAHLMAMQDLLRDKVRKAKHEQNRLNEALAQAEAGLDRLGSLPGLSLAIELSRSLGQDLEARASAEEALAGLIGRLPGIIGPINDLRAKSRILAGLTAVPGLKPARGLGLDLAALSGTKARARQLSGVVARLAALKPPVVLAPAPELARLAENQAKTRQAERLVQARITVLSGLASPPRLADPRPLADLTKTLHQAASRLAEQGRRVLDCRQALSAKAKAVAERLSQVGACPLCGQELDPGRFLGQGGADAAQD